MTLVCTGGSLIDKKSMLDMFLFLGVVLSFFVSFFVFLNLFLITRLLVVYSHPIATCSV